MSLTGQASPAPALRAVTPENTIDFLPYEPWRVRVRQGGKEISVLVQARTVHEACELGRRSVGGKRRVFVSGAWRARLHVCSACGIPGPWTVAWGWYGSLLQLDDGKPVVKWCSHACRTILAEHKSVPPDDGSAPIDIET